MGKIAFPLINVRKDVTNSWHMTHFTGETIETITVPQYADSNGYYTTFLLEIPDPGSTTQQYTTTPPKISGLVEFRGTPIDEKTRRIKLNPNQFYVNYQTGELLFHPNVAGNQFKVDYWGRGSLIEADDINYLNRRIDLLEKQRITPQFTVFEIEDQPEIVEVGYTFPKSKDPYPIKFKWEIDYPERIIDGSIKIEDITNNQLLGQNLENSGEFITEYHQSITHNNLSEQRFRITAMANSEVVVTRDLVIMWTYRINWGITQHGDKLGTGEASHLSFSHLFQDINTEQKIELNFPYAENHYKVIVTPKKYPIKKLIDYHTSFNFLIKDPVEVDVLNEYGLTIPSYTYISCNKIISKLKLICKLGEEN